MLRRASAACAGLVLAAFPLTGGCDSQVVLATQCPQVGRRCVAPILPDAGTLPPAGDIDDGQPQIEDAGPDGGPDAPDAAVEEPASVEAWFDNGSFEQTSAMGGELGVDGEGDVAVAPWVACRDSASVVTEADGRSFATGLPMGSDLVMANDGANFIQTTYPSLFGTVLGTELSQVLPEPLEVGRTYAFTIDLAAASVNTNILFLQVYGGTDTCDTQRLVGSSDIVPDRQGWRRACFEFTADEAYTTLTLAPRSILLVGPGTRMFLDNMRPVAGCE